MALVSPVSGATPRSLVLEPRGGMTPETKHAVLLSGDEEYRSEEALPMLAKILSQRHGFKCTVLFALDPDGTINPDNQKSLADAEALDSADVIIMALRFRQWPDEQMQHFVDAWHRGVPIIALRTSTHPFAFPADRPEWAGYSWNSTADPWIGGWGEHVVGETWVSHWGKHKAEATRGVVEPSAQNHPLLRGVGDVFGTTDVYEAAPPPDATILLRGLVLSGMEPDDEPAGYRKKRKSDGIEQPVNDPPMPIAWTRLHRNPAGKENRVLTTTMGAATDLENEGLRRLIVNGVYWALGREVPARADVRYVDPYEPRMYGFKGYRTGLTPADHALGKKLPPGGPPPGATASPPPNASASSTSPFTLHSSPFLTLAPGEHIALIGNGLADRMQHHGWLETLIHAKFPEHQLVFRNLAVAGDEVATRARSANFGTPDEWLTRVGADVVFAFFGYNESFGGAEGLPQFKEDLAVFLRHTLEQRYRNGAAPRIVLFSPLAAEHLPDPDRALPPPLDENLALYTAAMADVARGHPGVIFVNLHAPSQRLYAEAADEGRALTFNGVHLTAAGDAAFAPVIFEALFGEKPPPAAGLERLHTAVNDKSAMWHSRYRTVDGYNVYGGRSKLAFPSGEEGYMITNFEVMQQEMTQRDVLTANRDRRIWAVAQGSDIILDQSNLPPVTQVPTNLPGPNPDKSHDFIGGEEAIALMNVSPGLEVNLFASEEMFPELAQPVQMAWDTRGRLWVAAWNNYPERAPTSREGDRLLVFEDTDHDGRADKCTTFLDDLNCPTGFQFYRDGVLVMQAPDLWFVRDTDGDGRADWKERVLMGMDSADSHHTANSLIYTPGGAIFLSDGVFHRTQVETTRGVVRNIDAAIYRFEPVTGRFGVYASYAFANPHGRAFDRWGNDLIVDATGNDTYFGAAFSGRIDYPAKHPRMKTIWDRPMRPSAASMIITSRHFPDEFQGNFLNGNVIGFQGFYRVKLVDDGSGIRGERLPDFLSSSDPNFRPVALSVGPDGALYFLDWHNPIIGHMQHHIRDPNRDKVHGRIYRVTCAGRPLLEQPKIHDQPIPALLELLKEPENHVRELAKIELGRHPSEEVAAALGAWVDALDPQHPDFQHHLIEALWVCQWQNVVNEPLLRRMLRSPSADARAAATRVLCYWRERVPDALELLRAQADDEHPRVRLHAVRAASFFQEPAAIDVALIAARHPIDYYLDYTLGET
ncbi:MAG: PVC-type heme-binding CxxCH protein, partial [Opitutaceae bacterium]